MENENVKLWLYPNNYQTHDKQPDKTGTGEIPKAALKEFVEALKGSPGDTVKVECAGWERVSQKGNSYLFITLQIPREKPPADAPEKDDIPF